MSAEQTFEYSLILKDPDGKVIVEQPVPITVILDAALGYGEGGYGEGEL